MKDLLGIMQMEKEDVKRIVESAEKIKKNGAKTILQGKIIAMLFEKPSTRTRVSFEAAIVHMGGHPMNLDFVSTQISRGETMEDTGKVLSRYVDGITARLYKQEELEKLAEGADVPVINALTDIEHPCQALGDVLTIKEKKGSKVKVAFVGDIACNVANSLMLASTALGMEFVLIGPMGKYPPKEKFVEKAKKWGKVQVIDSLDGVEGCDVVYTDVWVSMGFESEKQERLKAFTPYQLNKNLLKKAKKDAIVMHCLPAKRGLEITSEVLDGPQSVVFDQAENRLHIQKAILAELLGA